MDKDNVGMVGLWCFCGFGEFRIQDAWRIALAFSSILSNLKVPTSFTCWSAIYGAASCKQLRVERQSDYVREFLIAKPHHSWIPPIHLLLLLFLTSWHIHRRCYKLNQTAHIIPSSHDRFITFKETSTCKNHQTMLGNRKKNNKKQDSNWPNKNLTIIKTPISPIDWLSQTFFAIPSSSSK